MAAAEKFVKPYGKKRKVETVNDEPSRTKQNLIADADINQLIKRHGLTHVQTNMASLESVYGQITSHDLQQSMEKIMQAEEAFMEVPSDIRKQFNNDAGEFIDFATNPDNKEKLIEMGLAPTPPQQIPDKPIELAQSTIDALKAE